jgi:hypothetical protein
MKNNEPRIVFTTIQRGAWSIGSGEENSEPDSRDTSPLKSQSRFPRLAELFTKIFERIKAPFSKKALSNLLSEWSR